MKPQSVRLGTIILALAMAALACYVGGQTAKISNAHMAKDSAGSQSASQFKPEENIFVVGDVVDAPSDTDLQAKWVAVTAEGIDANKVIWEHEEKHGSGKFSVSLPTEAGPRAAGKYQVQLYLNGMQDANKVTKVDYEVLKGTPTPTFPAGMPPGGTGMPPGMAGGDSLDNVHTSRDAADTQPAVAFAQGDTIYVHFVLNAAAGQAQIQGSLSTMAVEGIAPGTAIGGAQGSGANGPQMISFPNAMPWPIGVYRIDLVVDNMPAASLQIEVINTNNTGAVIPNAAVTVDSEGQQPVTVFPAANKTIYVQFTLQGAPEAVDVKGALIARDVPGMQPNSPVTNTGGQITDGSYVFSFPTQSTWPPGNYTVYIYVNGQAAQQVDFQIR